MKKIVCILLLVTNFSINAQTRLDNATIEEYLKIQNEFYGELCKPGTEENYLKLLKEYQGDGNYIPTLLDEKVDFKSIKSIIPLLENKILWINSLTEDVKKAESFSSQIKLLNEIKSLSEKLQDLKKNYYKVSEYRNEKTLAEAKKIFESLIASVEEFKNQTPFMLSFKFPVNHLALRSEYEKIKETNDKEIRAKANLVFFFRKVVQDGTLDEDGLRSDLMYRMAFDTFYLSLKSPITDTTRYFLTDAERVDLNYLVKNLEALLKLKPSKILKRLTDWQERIVRAKDFYNNLINNKVKINENSQLQDVTALLETRSKALYNLKEFSLTNEARVYEYWSKKSELFQSLFVLETILYSEVGRTDENVNYFRHNVAQVALNRLKDARFNSLAVKDPILKFLDPKIDHKKYPWLNVLFKEGEFSFTYFYIGGNLQIYCPDMGHIGKYLRKENLKIAMKVLGDTKKDFDGVRYYSRVSMLGRIGMETLWKDFTPVGEDPGVPILKNIKKLKDAYANSQYKYRYTFVGSDQLSYDVVEIKGQTYVVDPKVMDKFYTYRNPHLFRFFSYVK